MPLNNVRRDGDVVTLQQPPREPRSVGYGWACACHGGPRSEWRAAWGWRTVSPADWCPHRYAVRPPPAPPAVRDAVAIRSRPPLVAARPLAPGDTEVPADIPRLLHRLWTLGVPAYATYAASWWSRTVRLDPIRPPDADREQDDERDAAPIELPTGEYVKPRGRLTADVPVPRETVALRAPGIGVALWARLVGVPELVKGIPTGRMEQWKPLNPAWLARGGRMEKCTVTEFKQAIKEKE